MAADPDKNNSGSAPPFSRGWLAFFVLSLLLGAVLRLSYSGDIEFKYDEAFMFSQTQTAGISQPVPTLGMESSVGIRNPPLGIWVFLALSRLFSADTPPELARTVQILNILALAGLLGFAWRQVDPRIKENWLWTMALVCVNPIAVLLQRKIWTQSTLPLFCLLFILGWSRRDRWGGALLWGFLGAWLGQIHLSGFFFAAAVVIWTTASRLLQKQSRAVAWGPWAIGSILGSLTMVKWLHYYFQLEHRHYLIEFVLNWSNHPLFHTLFWQLWVSDPLGLGLSYSLGNYQFLDYLEYPLVGGQPTYLMVAAHLVILGLAGLAIYRLLARAWRTPVSWENVILGKPGSDTQLLLTATFFGYGMLLTLNGMLIPCHYLITTFPLEWLWWVVLFRQAFPAAVLRKALAALWICLLILSAGFLGYIHVNHGAQTGDYGVSFKHQLGN